MIRSQSLSVMERQASDCLKRYQQILKINIILNILIGLAVFIWPDNFTNLLGQTDANPDTWLRAWAMFMIATGLLYIPGQRSPILNMFPNVVGVVIRLALAIFYVTQGHGFYVMAIYEAAFAIILLLTYGRARRTNHARYP
jgi:hypothetical protein